MQVQEHATHTKNILLNDFEARIAEVAHKNAQIKAKDEEIRE